MAYTALRWFARGGTHLNFYMWWGGYNRGRAAAAGIMNVYASDAPLCPSGQRREPKFSHFQSLLFVLHDVAPVLLNSPSALDKQFQLQIRTSDGIWEEGDEQWGFLYQASSGTDRRRILFVENAANSTQTILAPLATNDKAVEFSAYSSMLFVDDFLSFYSANVSSQAIAFARRFEYDPTQLYNWSSWEEPVGPSPPPDPLTRVSLRPIEQTVLNIAFNISSDYAWYETEFHLDSNIESSTLFIETQEANAFVVYIDGFYAGAADTHNHLERNVTLVVSIGPLESGEHRLSLLSESLGYSNLIGRWGASTNAKMKGITGDVLLSISGKIVSLCDGRNWKSFPGLHGERQQFENGGHSDHSESSKSPLMGRWSSSWFATPTYSPSEKALFLDITRGRGHLYLNGIDLGRYWNITRSNTNEYSQRYYFLPRDYLHQNDQANELVFFDAFGSDHKHDARLLFSWIESSNSESLQDEVDYPLACI